MEFSGNNSIKSTNLRGFEFSLIPIGVLWILAIFLNLFVSISIATRSQKTYLNMIYLSITLSDLTTGLICITFEIFFLRFQAPLFNNVLCVINRYTEFSSTCIGLYSLLLLTIHRYNRLVKPAQEKESMTRARYGWLTAIWLGSFLFWVLLYLVLNELNIDAEICFITLEFYLVLVLDFLLQIVPLAVLVFFNFVLFRHLYDKIKHYNGIRIKYLLRPSKSRYPKKLRKDINASKYILVLTANIIVCWLLWIIDWPIHAFNGQYNTFYQVSYWLNYLLPTTNPIILLLFNRQMRQDVKDIFCYTQDFY